MQDQKVEEIVKSAVPGELPAGLIKAVKEAEALILVWINEQGALAIRPVVPGGAFEPDHDPVHAFVQQVMNEHVNLVRGIQGKTTDAIRYRALRDFAVMARNDKPRFEQVNLMLSKFEDGGNIAKEGERDAADQDKMADFLALAIQETEPELAAPTTEAEPAAPQIILPGAPRIAH